MTQATLDEPGQGSDLPPHQRQPQDQESGRVDPVCAGPFLIALVPLVWLLYTVVERGFRAVTSSTWWNKSLSGVLPEQFAGGVYHAIYGTIIQAVIAAVLAVPTGHHGGRSIWWSTAAGWFARTTTFMVDILAGVPSIVAALFIFALWIATMGFPQSAFAVSLALVLLMVPVVVRNTEEMLKLVPDELREAAYALGIPKWKTIARVVMPTALPGIISGILLALARVIGETAPVLVLVGYARSINYDPFDGNMASLPLLIYTELINPEEAGRMPGMGRRAYADLHRRGAVCGGGVRRSGS